MKYLVEFFETVKHSFEVEALNEEEAEQLAEEVYYAGEKRKQVKKIGTESIENEIGHNTRELK